VTPKVQELYIENGYPCRLVQEIMMCIYQFDARYVLRHRASQDRRLPEALASLHVPMMVSMIAGLLLCLLFPDHFHGLGTNKRELTFGRAITSNNAYKRRFKKREASKNAAAAAIKHAPQTRAKSTLDPPVLKVPGTIIEKDEFDLHWHMCLPVPDQLKLSEFTHHEQLLHSVDSFIRGVFDPGNKGWSADVTDFLGHVGNGSPTSYYQWRSVSDRCHSVALLVRAGHQGKAQTTLERLFQELGVLVRHPHPAFIVTFWRVCLRLLGVDTHIPQANAVSRLLSLVKESQADNKAVSLLASSLSQIGQADLRHALRIGYLKAIKTMAELVGDENIMVLEMASYYCKFFDTHYLVRQTLMAKYEYVWHMIHAMHVDGSRPAISISYAYAYAAYYVFDCPYVAIDMAEKLRNSAAAHPHLADPPRWTLEAEAFAFASKTVAELYRQQISRADSLTSVANEYGKCCASMQGATLKLEKGDRECRTRAAMISTALNRWFVEWGLQQEADEEAVRTRRILDSIEGKMCVGCIRVRYCRNCWPRVMAGTLGQANGNASNPGERCWCKPFKQSWLCQKCRIRNEKVGWTPSDEWIKVFRSEESDLSRWSRHVPKATTSS
jgi:NAD-dependent oxidoreductase involved in siderophore biosynthesis